MRFITRSLMGLMLMTLTLALLALAGNSIVSAYKNKSSSGFGNREARERVFTVEVVEVTLGVQFPEIQTFGEVVSGRTLELRAAATGELVQISDSFREGGLVKQGEILFQTDPSNAQSRLLISENELAEAEADLADARRNLTLAKDEVTAAENQLSLRNKAMERQDRLRQRGVGTDAAMEVAELATSNAEQALLSKRLSLANALAKISRAETLLGRRQINVDEASRLLADTTVKAEFDGVLSDISVVLGRLVSANEKLGSLIDPTALEIAFRVSNDEFRALEGGGLQQAEVRVSLGTDASFSGQIDRVSAAVAQGKTGRELFAQVQNAATLNIQPGDFVSVVVREPVLENVAKIPAISASTSGEVLIVGDENRLENATVEILRKSGNDLIVRADDIAGRQLVLARAPQLGEGIRVNPRAPGGPAIEAKKMVKLDADRRDKILTALKANKRLPEAVRDRLIKQFGQDEVPADALERVESRMAARASGTTTTNGETVEITEEQRVAMIAFVQANDAMPAEIKTTVLERLKQNRIPKAMFERISKRMGS
ncbi:MAG: HlyD family efflux transporter periplasmic adaptor subunit [Amylibacter sp.]|jgi:multidrug efflux pump subunit AcrA (membrane-fusion protein)|nr:HlyD family efflux transporter periplasmic adaptor subunit [Amylibacter sp.]